MEDGQAFCTSCGAPLRESDKFCIKCGAAVGAAPGQPSAVSNVQYSSKRSTTLWAIFAFAVIWAVLGTYIGIDTILNAQEQVDAILNGEIFELIEVTDSDRQFFVDVITAMGVLFLASGVMAAVTAVLVYVRKYHVAALILCIVGSLLALVSLVGIVGLIIAYFLNKSKNEFIPSGKGT